MSRTGLGIHKVKTAVALGYRSQLRSQRPCPAKGVRTGEVDKIDVVGTLTKRAESTTAELTAKVVSVRQQEYGVCYGQGNLVGFACEILTSGFELPIRDYGCEVHLVVSEAPFSSLQPNGPALWRSRNYKRRLGLLWVASGAAILPLVSILSAENLHSSKRSRLCSLWSG